MAQYQEDTFSLNITGRASFSRLADRASVRLIVTHTDKSKQDVSEKVLNTARAIESQLNSIQDRFKKERDEKPQTPDQDTSLPIAHWSKTSLTSTSHLEYNHKSETNTRTYIARIEFDLRFRDFAALGDFTATTSGLDYCEVEAVDWYLLDSTKKAYDTRLRKTAAANALAQAKDYCSVFCPDVEAVNIKPHSFSHEDATSQRGRSLPPPRMASAFRSSQTLGPSPNDADNLTFTPQECKMQLTINVLFHITTKGFSMSLKDDDEES